MPIFTIVPILQAAAAGMIRLAILLTHGARDLPEAEYAVSNFVQIEFRR